jgi:Outer membrane lipoprotein-sorting protein
MKGAMMKTIRQGVRGFAAVLLLAGVASAAEVPKMIAGKPYSISGSGGNYTVKWGDETMTWTPKPWMNDPLKQQGPAYYAQWAQPGMEFPFELTMEQREKLPADEIMDRCVAYTYYGPYHKGGADMWNNLVVKPDGSLRETQHFMELWQAYVGGKNQEFLTADERGDVSRKYMWIAEEPQEVRGQSGVTTDYYAREKRPSDTLYLPTVRKVRRLAGSVSKQFFPGTILRYEDVSHVRALPDLDYKIVGHELFKADPSVHGFGPNDYPDVRRSDGGGEVAVVLEITPKPGTSWWYAKRRIYCGMESMAYLYSEESDETGRVIRKVARGNITGDLSTLATGGPAPNWYNMWGALFVQDLQSGFKGDMWASNVQFNPKWPTNIFSNETLLREPRGLGFWE